ncbi:MAG: Protein-glutamine gamma-glutamyltransferase [Firmicutes bacterium ADurb.Bin182]|nr:MAG: Protein-glutamine gamma-glutamyltransferase [Firmicutes bacterium ADurb.Bin182]
MISIKNETFDIEAFESGRQLAEIEKSMLGALNEHPETFRFDSSKQLLFELKLRGAIIQSSRRLNRSGMSFEVFRKSKCNEAYWDRMANGGFSLKSSVKPSDAIRDIFINGRKYATECATAMVIVYYGALLELYSEELFNKLFPVIHLMNWHDIDRNLREIGIMNKEKLYLPGDRRYFDNPDVDPETPYWQGENVIDLGNGQYYGHGIGIGDAEVFIRALNRNRKEDADESAYFMDACARPNFKRLHSIQERFELNRIL